MHLISCFTDSGSYFHSRDKVDAEMLRFQSMRGRFICLGVLVEKLLLLPLILLCKSYKTFMRLLGVAVSAALLLLTMGLSVQSREFFTRRAASFSKDLADWLFFPLAMTTCLARLALAFTVHPALYLKF